MTIELTAEEREALICDCGNSLTEECPAHGGGDHLWVDVPAHELVQRAEHIVAAKVAAAEQRAERITAAVEALADEMDDPNTERGTMSGVRMQVRHHWATRLRALTTVPAAVAQRIKADNDETDRQDYRAALLADYDPVPGLVAHGVIADPAPREYDDGGPRVREAVERAERVEVVRGWRTYDDGSTSPVERWVRAADGDWVSLDSTRRTSGDIHMDLTATLEGGEDRG